MQARLRGRVRVALAVISVGLVPSGVVPSTTAVGTGGVAPESQSASAPAPPDWLAEAQRSIAEREYEATDEGAGLQAPNRAQGLRTYFDSEGARIVDREDDLRELASLRTVAVGRDETRSVSGGEVVADGARVEICREGLVETFENTERGLEQSWTFAERPAGNGPLAVEVDLGGTIASVDAGTATVVTEGGRLLEYGGLAVWDAAGTALAPRMEYAGESRVRIVVDDADAVYPVTIDPALSTPVFATLINQQVAASTGESVAGAGDVNNDGYDDVIVGSPTYDSGQVDEGAAFVFLGGPGGIASGFVTAASARLESDQASANFGFSVAGAGDVNNDGFDDVIIGAYLYDSGQTNEGAAFVFLGSPAGIASGNPSTAATVLQSNQADGNLGSSVAGAGDVNDDGFADVIVGAVLYDSGQSDEGAAFIFLGSPTGIPSGNPTTANTFLQSNQATSRFGVSVAIAGDTNNDGYDDVIVGARLYDLGQGDEGAAFVWLGGAAGIANGNPTTASATLQSNQGAAYFGAPVAGAGDVNGDGFDDVVVGSNSYDSDQTDEGAAFVFLGTAAGVANGSPTTAATTLQGDQTGALLGYSVAGAGDINGDGYDDVIVGAYSYDAGLQDEGIALLFLGSASGIPNGSWTTTRFFLQQDRNSASFGASVAGAGDVDADGYDDVIIGAPNHGIPGFPTGQAFVYRGGADGLNGFPGHDELVRGGQAQSNFGGAVAGAGDVNGDGYDDIIVGAPTYDLGQQDEGAVFVYLGGPSGIPSGDPAVAATFLQSNQAFAYLGTSVDRAGDVNGDGFDDVIVGADGYTGDGFPNEGAAFVFLGGPNGIPSGSLPVASATLQSHQQGSFFGSSVAGAGDVNNDGYDDVVVGAREYDQGEMNEGVTFVFHGSASGIASGNPTTANALLQGNSVSANSGTSVDGAGDVNGDGYDDVVVGEPYYSAQMPITYAGRVKVYLGGFGGVGTLPSAIIETAGQTIQVFFGVSVAGAGDVNGDGYDDIIVGAYGYSFGESNEGAAFVFHGGPSGITASDASQAATRIESNEPNARSIGTFVAGVGDVDGDGFDDIAVAAFGFSSTESGMVLVYLGSPTGVPSGTPLTAVATLIVAGALNDLHVARAGDIDNDGFADIVVGSNDYDGVISQEGAALVYHLGRPAVAPSGADTVGIYVPASGAWFLKNSNGSGSADATFFYGPGGAGWIGLRGDWDGNGTDTPGLYNPAVGAFFLKNSIGGGNADLTFFYGPGGQGWIPLAGDWDGNGTDTIGLYNPTVGAFFLKNTNAGGNADLTFFFGPGGQGWTPLTGDWDGNGTDTIGLYNPSVGAFFLKNSNAGGNADLTFFYGPGGQGWKALAGDFDGNGADTIGLYSPSNGFFFLRNANAPGAADLTFSYGPGNVTPLVGDWDGL